MKRDPKTWEVYESGRDYFVRGLTDEFDGKKDLMLLYRYSSDESETPDVDTPRSPEKMERTVRDLVEWCDGVRSGDTFVTPFGTYVV